MNTIILGFMFMGAIVGFLGSFFIAYRIEDSNPILGAFLGIIIGFIFGVLIIL